MLNDDYHFSMIGVLIIGIFVFSWITSIIAYRYMGYHKLEHSSNDLTTNFTPLL